MKKRLIYLVILFVSYVSSDFCITQKEHEKWWETNVEKQMETFASWLGGIQAESRITMREYIKNRGYKSVLDIPCGLCTELLGYKADGMDIAYLGIDITEKLITRAQSLGINAIQGSIESIPLPDSSIEVCYARHILEHLDYYELALNELIRVARDEVIVIFFIKPHKADDYICSAIDRGCVLYHNAYNKNKIERFIHGNAKVDTLIWECIGEKEEALHIYLRN
ncbi:methyltransferase domain-containing protein [Candidatus Dependentiae bacterium]|nr:methyltransferase domain-containing protein [Candidatus Dependentiae bacterium]